MQLRKTDRGFAIGEFNDIGDRPCSLQKSSLATEDAIWFGVQDAKPMCKGEVIPFIKDTLFSTRMHLTQDMAKELATRLKQFVKTGTVDPMYKVMDRYGSPYSLFGDRETIWLGMDDAAPQALACHIYEHYKDKPEILAQMEINQFSLGWRPLPYPEGTTFNIRMHLNQTLVKKLLPYLNKFVQKGELT